MQVVLEIPDDLEPRLVRGGKSAKQTTLEALASEGYRSGALSGFEARRLLGLGTRYEFDAFLQERGVEEGSYDLADLEQDRRTLANLPE